jgi:hypothetical protein
MDMMNMQQMQRKDSVTEVEQRSCDERKAE